MNCVFCGFGDTRVVDSRIAEGGSAIRRRRECTKCGGRFTTYERAELDIVVVKKDGRREPYQKEKLLAGIMKACQKRPISYDTIVEMIDWIERRILSKGQLEVPSSFIGDLVMRKLKKLDEVAYIRFASVYRQFKDVASFEEELRKLTKKRVKNENKDSKQSKIQKHR
ncbi:transcriptional regulator NrdR [Candidatus Woesearchaeota archaeon]|nr:transcriptional regulator NrdR [Candidatus Woesearchaeota archaeon]RLE42468.1 MAG: transcriptional regulator NrdR [Candidatus Woesearchaeota archaeon]